ncbi:MAG: hypothetical protein H6711_26260 [Myxococcales bacterium]|nr:hypothetical protein [Myxococcales bacterium]
MLDPEGGDRQREDRDRREVAAEVPGAVDVEDVGEEERAAEAHRQRERPQALADLLGPRELAAAPGDPPGGDHPEAAAQRRPAEDGEVLREGEVGPHQELAVEGPEVALIRPERRLEADRLAADRVPATGVVARVHQPGEVAEGDPAGEREVAGEPAAERRPPLPARPPPERERGPREVDADHQEIDPRERADADHDPEDPELAEARAGEGPAQGEAPDHDEEEEREAGLEAVERDLQERRVDRPDEGGEERGDRRAQATAEEEREEDQRAEVEGGAERQADLRQGVEPLDRLERPRRRERGRDRHQPDVERLEAVGRRAAEERPLPLAERPGERQRDVGVVGDRPAVEDLDRPREEPEPEPEREGEDEREGDAEREVAAGGGAAGLGGDQGRPWYSRVARPALRRVRVLRGPSAVIHASRSALAP